MSQQQSIRVSPCESARFSVRRGAIRVGGWIGRMAELGSAMLGGFRHETCLADACRLDAFERGSPSMPAVLLLHGFSGDKSIWLPFARRLPTRFRLMVPDLCGHGRNQGDQTLDYGVEEHARRMLALLDARQIERVHLVGSSMGGLIAATIAAEHPARIASITLLGPAGVPGAQINTLDRLANSGRNPFLIANEEDFERLFRMIMHRPPYVPGVVKAWLCEQFRERRAHLARMYGAYERSLGLPCVYSRVAAPALVIWGQQDALFDVHAAPAMLRSMPHAELQICAGLGHLPMLEAPARVANLVSRFLASVAPFPDPSPATSVT